MIRRPPRSTLDRSSAASDVYKRQGNNRVFFTDENSNGSIDTSEVISVHSYYPGGMDFGQKKNTNEEFGYRFGGKEELEFTKYLSFGARCLSLIHISEPTRPY